MATSTLARTLTALALPVLVALAQSTPTGAATTAPPASASHPHAAAWTARTHPRLWRRHLRHHHVAIYRHTGRHTGQRAADASGGASSGVTYHGGPVMHSLTAYLIFWRPDGYSFEQAGSDQSYVGLIQRYFQDVGGSDYAAIASQYGDTNGTIGTDVTLGGAVLDTTPYPHAGTTTDPVQDGDIRNEISTVMQQQGWSAGPDTMFYVFTASGVQSCADAALAQCSFNSYCAYHAAFTTDGTTPIIYANMPDVEGNAGCLVAPGSPNGDPVADNEMIGLSHEHLEAVSDPLATGGWYDTTVSGEIGDLCHATFGPLNADGSNVTLNGDPYIVQAEWSNQDQGCVVAPGSGAIPQG